jgi:RNA polymerase subunit RPABC4/transcription elongation factor Spt4
MTLLLLVALSLIIYYFFIYKEAYKNLFDHKSNKKCPNCGNPVEASYNVCPVCKETLNKKCGNCGNMVDVNWKYCPYCTELLKKGDN